MAKSVPVSGMAEVPIAHRILLDKCELPSQQDRLDLYRARNAVTTASSMQVRQPIYAGSVQRCKQLEHRLQLAKAIFAVGGIES